MVEPKKTIGSGKSPVERPNNGFTTERSVGGERRSIRHYHDGRLSQRESPVPGPVQTLIKTNIMSKTKSTRPFSKLREPEPEPEPKLEPETEYESPTLAEIERLSGAVATLFHPDRSNPSEKPPPRTMSPQSWSSESSYGMVTPPFPVASPTPGDSPELMSTDVLLPPATARSDGSDDDADSISKKWKKLGGKKRIGSSDIHD
ncbi:hypothetical protein CBS147332_7396 [Penicillium roqueforti]|nr:hypothetical protein CBS147332_7396 [Penicillium roqueforti]KAI3097754.1 hypothetical protein CBS147331_8951 [Penicillium roqueforti]